MIVGRTKVFSACVFLGMLLVGCATSPGPDPFIASEPVTNSPNATLPDVPETGAGRSLLADKRTQEPDSSAPNTVRRGPTSIETVPVDIPPAIQIRPLPMPTPTGESLDVPWAIPASRIDDLWNDYTNFEYENVIAGASRIIVQQKYPSCERAMAMMLSGASAYLLGDSERALTYFVMAWETDPSVQPEEDQFPAQIIRRYRRVNGLKKPDKKP